MRWEPCWALLRRRTADDERNANGRGLDSLCDVGYRIVRSDPRCEGYEYGSRIQQRC